MKPPSQLPLFNDQPLSEADLFAGTPLRSTVGLFQRHLLLSGKTEHTVSAFTSDLHLLLEFLGSDTHIGAVTTANLNAFLDWMEHGRGVSCSRKTYARRVTTLKVFFKWLHALGAIEQDPAVPVLQRSGPAPLAAVISEDEAVAVLLHTARLRRGEKPDARPDLLFRLLLDTGIKKHEVMRLTREDIEPGSPPMLAIRPTSARTVYRERRIELDPDWLIVLNEYLQQYQPVGAIFNCTARNLEYVLEDVGYAAGLTYKLSFEMLRWSCAVRDYRGGMDPDRIREKLGLSRISWFETFAKIRILAGETRSTSESAPDRSGVDDADQ
jgi:integrase/recombinase XerD